MEHQGNTADDHENVPLSRNHVESTKITTPKGITPMIVDSIETVTTRVLLSRVAELLRFRGFDQAALVAQVMCAEQRAFSQDEARKLSQPERISHAGECTNNKPFLHIKRIQDKCVQTSGALRKTIRLLKNLRYDSDTKIALSSYDIAAIAWHMSEAELAVPYGVDLMLVEKARAHLGAVASSQTYRNLLWVPDGSRLIFDKPEKVRAAQQLYFEVDQLARDIFKELDPNGPLFNRPYRSEVLAKSIQLG